MAKIQKNYTASIVSAGKGFRSKIDEVIPEEKEESSPSRRAEDGKHVDTGSSMNIRASDDDTSGERGGTGKHTPLYSDPNEFFGKDDYKRKETGRFGD